MDTNTARWLRLVLSSLVAGCMGAGTVLLSSITAEGNVKPGGWLTCVVTFVLFAAKDAQSGLSTSPTTPPVDDQRAPARKA